MLMSPLPNAHVSLSQCSCLPFHVLMSLSFVWEQVKQFYSDLTLLDYAGRVIQQKTISVNDPLRAQVSQCAGLTALSCPCAGPHAIAASGRSWSVLARSRSVSALLLYGLMFF